MSKISLDPTKEEELIKKSKRDKEAFGELYKHYYNPIKNFVKQKVDILETAEDITSVVFQKAFESLESFKWQGISFSSWLYRIARNTIIDHYRKTSKKETISISNYDLISNQKNPEEEYETLEFEDKINIILQELPEKERKIVYMKFFEGYTNKTISSLTGLSESNVGTILHRAILKLRERF